MIEEKGSILADDTLKALPVLDGMIGLWPADTLVLTAEGKYERRPARRWA